MFDKNMSILYPLAEIDAYSVDTFCTAKTFGSVYRVYDYIETIFWLA